MFNPRECSRQVIFFSFLLVACLLFCGIARAVPSITLSKKSGPPTSRILVSGRGFGPNVGVDIYFDTKDKALVITDGKGEFGDVGIHAPRTAYPGRHWVTALQRNDDKGAQEPFLVQTDWAQFQFDAAHTGYNPYENVLNRSNVSSLALRWQFPDVSDTSSPAIANGLLYIVSNDGHINALNASTAAVTWSYKLGTGSEFSPVVSNGIVYVAAGYDLYALSAATGTVLWKYPTTDWIIAPPTVEHGVVYVEADCVYALDASSGAFLWKYCAAGWYIVAPAAVADGVVYVSEASTLDAFDSRSGVLLWSDPFYGSFSSPAVVNGGVYVGSYDGFIYAANASTGKSLWTYNTGGKGSSSPAVVNELVYIGSQDSDVYALDTSTGALRWKYKTVRGVSSSAVVANGVVYVGSNDENVDALNASTGALLWSYAMEGPPIALAVTNGLVYATSGDLHLSAFSLKLADFAGYTSVSRPDERRLHPNLGLRPSTTAASQVR
jgi:outer membrane protein assembly factor BamB